MDAELFYPEVFDAFPVRRPSERGGWDIPCPCLENHRRGDRRWSARLWMDHGHMRFWCGKGCKWIDAIRATGVDSRLWYLNRGKGMTEEAITPRKEIAWYPYTDAQGNVMYEKVRTDPKGFYHRRPGPGGKGYVYSLFAGWYVWNKSRWVAGKEGDVGAVWMDDCRKVPFQWLDLRAKPDHPICVVEGEKAARHLKEIGFVAICSPDGAGKWPLDFGGYLASRDVVTFPDNDEPGMLHAAQVIGSAVLYGARSFRIVRPNAGDYYSVAEGGDIYDWLKGQSVYYTSIIKQRQVEYDALRTLVKKFPKMTWESVK